MLVVLVACYALDWAYVSVTTQVGNLGRGRQGPAAGSFEAWLSRTVPVGDNVTNVTLFLFLSLRYRGDTIFRSRKAPQMGGRNICSVILIVPFNWRCTLHYRMQLHIYLFEQMGLQYLRCILSTIENCLVVGTYATAAIRVVARTDHAGSTPTPGSPF